jgi:methylenetetrahydrofolate dehydrogenase (NADP+) / methenyltetrahydrofolate cyclohydrolase
MALLYGKPVADKLLAETKARIEAAHIIPGLAVILVGDDAPSHIYVNLKEKAAQSVGIHFEKYIFPKTIANEEIFKCIGELNLRSDIHGIVVQLPLPTGFPTDEIIARIDPRKDMDGFHPETVKKFLAGELSECPVFPRAMIELLRSEQNNYNGDKGLVLANSELLGKVLARALINEGLQAKYILSKEKSEIISEKTKEARVILTACGIPNLIMGEMISEDIIVIDGGISHHDGKVVGDAERASVEKKARFLSPVPGGVGPVTVATLLARVTERAVADNI